MPSICTQYATVGLHLTVPGRRVLQLNHSLNAAANSEDGKYPTAMMSEVNVSSTVITATISAEGEVAPATIVTTGVS